MTLDKDKNVLVQLDFYEGAYGPTLRIGIPSRELLEKIKDVFRALAEEKYASVDLAQVKFVFAGNVTKLDLVLVKQPGLKTLSLLEGMQFVWRNSSEGWQRCLGLLEGFGEEPAHQYLTREGFDDALVEVAYLEH